MLMQKPAGQRAEHTAMSFEVHDIGAHIRALQARGVVFEDYDLPGLRTVEQISVRGSKRAAWFKDLEGNILCLHEVVGG
jgi:predicted enzyme related to lactoylglutathione lyase